MGIVVCLLCRYDCDLHWDPHLLGEIVVIRGVFFFSNVEWLRFVSETDLVMSLQIDIIRRRRPYY